MARRMREDRSKKEKRSLKNILYKDSDFVINYSNPLEKGGLENINLKGKYEKESFNIMIYYEDLKKKEFTYNILAHKGSGKPKVYLGGTDLRDNTCLIEKEISYFLKEAQKKLDEIKKRKLDQWKAVRVDYASELIKNTIQHRIDILNNKKKFYR